MALDHLLPPPLRLQGGALPRALATDTSTSTTLLVQILALALGSVIAHSSLLVVLRLPAAQAKRATPSSSPPRAPPASSQQRAHPPSMRSGHCATTTLKQSSSWRSSLPCRLRCIGLPMLRSMTLHISRFPSAVQSVFCCCFSSALSQSHRLPAHSPLRCAHMLAWCACLCMAPAVSWQCPRGSGRAPTLASSFQPCHKPECRMAWFRCSLKQKQRFKTV